MGGLALLGKGTAVASAPGTGASVASTSGVAIFSFHTPDTFILFFFAQNVSTKGKIFNTPWDHARPGHGQRGALACQLPATPEKSSHLATVLS